MANKRLFQFLYTKQPKLTMITGGFMIGASGSVASGSVTGAGIYQLTQLGTGTYKVKLADNYVSFLDADYRMHSSVGATEVGVASLVSSSTYQIAVVGNSTWSTVGADSDYTAVVGQPFVATNVAGSGTGTAKLLSPSGIVTIETLRNGSSQLTNGSPNLGKGSSFIFQTLANTVSSNSTSVSTLVATNAAGSSTMTFKLWFKDSSVLAL